jgi:hypothetical protein
LVHSSAVKAAEDEEVEVEVEEEAGEEEGDGAEGCRVTPLGSLNESGMADNPKDSASNWSFSLVHLHPPPTSSCSETHRERKVAENADSASCCPSCPAGSNRGKTWAILCPKSEGDSFCFFFVFALVVVVLVFVFVVFVVVERD